MSTWLEVGDRCWVRRYDEWDLNVGLIVGSDGALVIDTRATTEQASELQAHIREVTDSPVRWVVNTHAHFDHVAGNSVFTDAAVYLHENAAAEEDLDGTTFAVAKVIDLGDRRVELLHLGNAHTSGDTVVVVPDVDVYFVGDLIEESAPPSYGRDSFPLDWPDTIDRVIGLLSDTSKVVPGHGAVVDAEFVRDQAGESGHCREHHLRSAPRGHVLGRRVEAHRRLALAARTSPGRDQTRLRSPRHSPPTHAATPRPRLIRLKAQVRAAVS